VAGYPDLIVAFIGDQGNNEDAQAVLALIKNEGAQAVVHNGDFDYANSPSGWVTMIDGGLDASFPYFAVFGNHEGAVQTGYAQALANRANGIPEMRDNCTGTYGYNTSCNFRGIRIVQSCVGLGELDPIRCGKDAAQPINHIHDSLANDNSIWSICNWHKVQAQMTVGDNTDEAGWQAYQECMNAGAIVITAHNHTYSRSYTLTDIANTNVSANKGAIGTHDVMQVGPGRTFALVVGIGGRALYTRKAAPEAWWASYYTDTRWRQSGTTGDGLLSPSGKQGALFIKFNAGGDPRRAEAWVKDVTPITPRIMDTFTIQAL
jgi:predicted phosphodiesterase